MKQSSLCSCLCFMSSGWLASKAKPWLDGAQSPSTPYYLLIVFLVSNLTLDFIQPALQSFLCLGFVCLSMVNGYDKNIRLFIHYCKQKANWSIINKLFPHIIPFLRKYSTTSIFLDWRSFCLLFPAPLTFHRQRVSGVDPQWSSKPPKCLHCVLIHRRRGDCDEVWINSQSNSFRDKIKTILPLKSGSVARVMAWISCLELRHMGQ